MDYYYIVVISFKDSIFKGGRGGDKLSFNQKTDQANPRHVTVSPSHPSSPDTGAFRKSRHAHRLLIQ
jgi:hypothetical protein